MTIYDNTAMREENLMQANKIAPWKTRGRAALAALLLMAGLGVPVHAAPTNIEDYLRQPDISEMVLSPSGQHAAVAVTGSNGHQQLAVITLDPLGKQNIIAAFGDADVRQIRWVNDERLVYGAANRDISGGENRARGLFAINRDGSAKRELIAHVWTLSDVSTHIVSRVLPWQWQFEHEIDDGSPDVIISERRFNSVREMTGTLLYRLNTATGERRSLSDGAPPNAFDWLTDPKGEPRLIVSHADGRTSIHWRGTDRPEWTRVAEFATYGTDGFVPVYVDGDGQIYVQSALQRDTEALYRFDPVARKIEAEPLVGVKGYDLSPVIESDTRTGQVLGLHFDMEQPVHYWFDKDLRRIQQSIDAALPADRTNLLICGRCTNGRFIGIKSGSDRESGEYFVFDRKTLSLQRVGAARPWLPEATQGHRSHHLVPARDGLPLPVYLTRPADAPAGAALPTVVHVHGGPYLRGHTLSWDRDAQLLASRGYLVIEVDFRGSYGYGTKHFRAGWKQWGRAMQDDLDDALAWAVKQGQADASRVCILGASYGGYAALMGVARNPDAYRCAVSLAGVSDLDLMYSYAWSDADDTYKRYGMPVLIGDRQADAEQLKASSPLKQVARIKAPILLAHGGDDARVPIVHSRSFRQAAERAGVKVESVEYLDEGHGLRQPKNELDYWKRVEAFLKKNLAPAGAP